MKRISVLLLMLTIGLPIFGAKPAGNLEKMALYYDTLTQEQESRDAQGQLEVPVNPTEQPAQMQLAIIPHSTPKSPSIYLEGQDLFKIDFTPAGRRIADFFQKKEQELLSQSVKDQATASDPVKVQLGTSASSVPEVLPVSSDKQGQDKRLFLLTPYLQNTVFLLGAVAALALIVEGIRWSITTPASHDMQIVRGLIDLAEEGQLDVDWFDSLAKELTVVSRDRIEIMRGLIESDIIAAINYMDREVLEDLQKQHDAQGIVSRLKRGANIRANQLRSLGKSAVAQGQDLVAKTRALFVY